MAEVRIRDKVLDEGTPLASFEIVTTVNVFRNHLLSDHLQIYSWRAETAAEVFSHGRAAPVIEVNIPAEWSAKVVNPDFVLSVEVLSLFYKW